jgi:TolB protein
LTGWLILSPPVQAAETEPNSIFIKVGEATVKRSPVAIPALLNETTPPLSESSVGAGREIHETIVNNLSISSYFDFIKPSAYLENVAKVSIRPISEDPKGFRFDSWKEIGAEFLIRGSFVVSSGQISLDAQLYHVPTQRRVLGKTYRGRIADARRVAHTFSNDVIKELTGQNGIFLSKIAVARGTRDKQREIFVMDWDGANPRQITNHQSLSISPAWSFDGQWVAYSAMALRKNLKRRNLDLFMFQLPTDRRLLVSYEQGNNSGANFLPGEDGLLLTRTNSESASGNTDIFRISRDGTGLRRLTNGPGRAMNVEPAVSPDGRRIAFSSDRSGVPMIYVMNIDGSDARRITFAGFFNSGPRWSPDGKRITFSAVDRNTDSRRGFSDIFVMDADGTNMIRLTSAKKPNGQMADHDSPSFSPDGRLVMYVSNRTGNRQIFVSAADGSDERRVTFDRHDYSQPVWSPRFE